MDFIWFIIIFGFGFVIIINLLEWALPILFENVNNNPRCEDIHKWEYDDKGFLRCSICKYKALDD